MSGEGFAQENASKNQFVELEMQFNTQWREEELAGVQYASVHHQPLLNPTDEEYQTNSQRGCADSDVSNESCMNASRKCTLHVPDAVLLSEPQVSIIN